MQNDPRRRESVFPDLDDAFRNHSENDGLGRSYADLDDPADRGKPEDDGFAEDDHPDPLDRTGM